MVTDYFKDFDFMKEFTYGPSSGKLGQSVERGSTWAESKTDQRRRYYDSVYPWRRRGKAKDQ